MSEPFVHIAGLQLRYRQHAVLKGLDWTIQRGSNWVLCGESGSGKTSLAKAIAGLLPYAGTVNIHFDPHGAKPPLVHYVDNWYQFKDLEGQSNFYYQQRYNRQSAETTATVGAELKSFGEKHGLSAERLKPVLEALNYTDLLGATLIQLSSGEHKKLQLIKALWLAPQLLLLDQPYNGLDRTSRQNLNRLIDQLANEGTQFILIANDLELPGCIRHFAKIKGGLLEEIPAEQREIRRQEGQLRPIPEFLQEAPVSHSAEVIGMRNVSVTYGDKQVLKAINWEVKAGEKWLLQGHNGSGKSTLLSLVCGDHPQAYANDLSLFGHQRGSGESIWEIKERIGLISPELHWYFDASATVWQSIVSGFYDSSGLYCDPGYTKKAQTDELVDYFGLTAEKNMLMAHLPLGKQRLALLARTIIKNPELLILDEPCQGLDQHQTQHFNQLVDELCGNGRTLIYVGHFETQIPQSIEKRILLDMGEVKALD